MKLKHLLLTIAVLFVAAFAYGQDTSVVTIQLPKTFDFSTADAFMKTGGILLSAVLTVITGFWSKGNDFLKKYLPTTEKRVAVVGFLVSVGVGLAFGFSKDTINLIWTSLLGVFVGLGSYGTAKNGSTAKVAVPSEADEQRV